MSEISGINDFAKSIFEAIKIFVKFGGDFLINVPNYLKTLIDFFITYVVEFPIILVSMFGELPIFVQTGLTVVVYALYIAFMFRLVKLIVPFLQEVLYGKFRFKYS